MIVACVSYVSLGDVCHFSMSFDGYDLKCDGLYQVPYSNWLEDVSYSSVRVMSGVEHIVYLAWGDSNHPLRGMVKEYVTTGSCFRK